MNKKYIFFGIILVITLHYIFYLLGTIRITAQFEELEPFHSNLPVYYKGFRLGKTTKIYPSDNYIITNVDMRLKSKDLHLPANVTATLKRKDKKEYIELVYPQTPFIEELKYNTIIKGDIGINFERFLQDQVNNGGLDEIKSNVNNTVKSAGETFEALTGLLIVFTEIMQDIKPTINSSVKNLEMTTENFAKISASLKTSVDKGYIDSTLYNFQKTSGNLVLTTKNFGGFSDTLNKESSILTNCLLKNLNIVVSNINQIVIGVGDTLKKNFGGVRLFFGKAINCK